MKKIILLVLISGTLSSCQFLITTLYGVKKPRYEKEEAIRKRQLQLFGDTLTGLVIKAASYEKLNGGGLPEVYIFDRTGKQLSYINPEKPGCNAPAAEFLSNLDPHLQYPVSSEFMLDSFALMLNEPDCGKSFVLQKDSSDYYIFMTWAIWTGRKIYDEETQVWIKHLSSNQKGRFRIYLINLDLQECWTDTEKQSLGISPN